MAKSKNEVNIKFTGDSRALNKTLKDLTSLKAKLEQQEKRYSAEVSRITHKIASYNKQLRDINKSERTLTAEHLRLIQQNSKLANQFDALAKMQESYRTRTGMLSREVSRLYKNNVKLSAESNKLLNQHTASQKQVASLRVQTGMLSREVNKLYKNNVKLSAESNKLLNQYTDTQRRVTTLKIQTGMLSREVDHLAKNNKVLNTRHDAQSKTIRKLSEDKRILISRVKGLKDTKRELSNIIATTRGQYAKTSRELDSLRGRMERAERATKRLKSASALISRSFGSLWSLMKMPFGITNSILGFMSRLYLSGKMVQGVIGRLAGGIKEVFAHTDEFRLMESMITSTILSANKDPFKSWKENIIGARKEARELTAWMVRINNLTIADYSETSRIMLELTKAGVQIDRNSETAVRGFTRFVNAIAVSTANMRDSSNQARQEANAVLNTLAGKGREVSNLLKSVFGDAWKQIIIDAKEKNNLLELFDNIFAGFDARTSEMVRTWKAQYSTISTFARYYLSEAFGDIYDDIMDHLQTFSDVLRENGDIIIKELKPAFNDWYSSFKDLVNEFITNLPTIMGSIHSIFKSVTSLISASIKGVGALGRMVLPILKRLMGVVDEKHVREMLELSRKSLLDNPPDPNETNRGNLERDAIRIQRLERWTRELKKLEEFKKLSQDLENAITTGTTDTGGEGGTAEDSLISKLTGLIALYKEALDNRRKLNSGESFGDEGQPPQTDISSEVSDTAEGSRFKGNILIPVTEELPVGEHPIARKNRELTEHVGGLWTEMTDDLEALSSDFLYNSIKNVDSLKNVWENFTQSVADMFARMVANMVAKWAVIQALNILLPGSGSIIGAGYDASGLYSPPTNVMTSAVGQDFVPRDMISFIHEGEAIVPAKQNQFLQSGKFALVNPKQFGETTNGDMVRSLDGIANSMERLATRPIQNVIDFGESQMIQLSRQMNKTDYRRREAFI